jgi:hypothetical protein
MKLNARLSRTLVAVLWPALMVPAGAQQLAERSPGLWQVDSLVQIPVMGVKQSTSVQVCITPELARLDLAPPEVLQDDGWVCKWSTVSAKAPRLGYALACLNGAASAQGNGEVVVGGAKQFSAKSRVDADLQGTKLVVESEHSARFVAVACADAPPLKWENVAPLPAK